jgi:hypothetical protein
MAHVAMWALRFLEVARCDDDGGSGRCQPPSHAKPDAAIAACHHGDLSAQIEQLCPPRFIEVMEVVANLHSN